MGRAIPSLVLCATGTSIDTQFDMASKAFSVRFSQLFWCLLTFGYSIWRRRICLPRCRLSRANKENNIFTDFTLYFLCLCLVVRCVQSYLWAVIMEKIVLLSFSALSQNRIKKKDRSETQLVEKTSGLCYFFRALPIENRDINNITKKCVMCRHSCRLRFSLQNPTELLQCHMTSTEPKLHLAPRMERSTDVGILRIIFKKQEKNCHRKVECT